MFALLLGSNLPTPLFPGYAKAFTVVITKLPASSDRQPWRPRRPSVPAEIRRPFLVAGNSALVAWAVSGLFLPLIPSFVTMVLGRDNLALAGAIVALMLGLAALVQFARQKLEPLRAQTVGLVVMTLGAITLVIADLYRSLIVLLLAAMLAGLGQGRSSMGSLGDINELSPEDRKGDIVASYYVVVYIGTALPAIGAGMLAQLASLPTAIQVFAYIVIAICPAGLTP